MSWLRHTFGGTPSSCLENSRLSEDFVGSSESFRGVHIFFMGVLMREAERFGWEYAQAARAGIGEINRGDYSLKNPPQHLVVFFS